VKIVESILIFGVENEEPEAQNWQNRFANYNLQAIERVVPDVLYERPLRE